MRVFSAIPFPENIKSLTGRLLQGKLPVNYVNTDNLHITLNFFGELETDQVARLKDLFQQILKEEKSFPVEFDKLAKFHSQIHMTLKPNEALKNLQDKMKKAFSAIGGSASGGQDREYYPHVKIANMHFDKVMNMNRKIENFPNNELSQLNFKAEKVVLYESKLLLHHAHHYPLVKVKLL
ncbi:MAG: RNA 2',3'-cyclic phosphodiesterase [Candidatus Doudnabacteria bacterium]|nr:RNA 2',3'-cyclic phosphodiesterase [Candidatus Doudnabacteria bacterium]